ncbi:MAG: hypothetical protein C4554_04735 [Dethiobacter sp.]|nr:MAG: hypothetical protein C4554_04735 [Dethiobacter sp.]
MQIKRLEIKNCLGIKELELQAGQINLIKGANESGKTSILEVIEKALRNTERRVKFVRDGAEEGTLYVELDNGLAIDRRIKADGKSSISLTQDGTKIPKPETALRAITGAFSFNPVDFMSCKDKEQTEILLSLLPMRLSSAKLQQWFGELPPVNLEQHAIPALAWLAEKYFYDKRTIANNEVKQGSAESSALFEQLPDNYDGDAWREVNIGALWQDVQTARRINDNREAAAAMIRAYKGEHHAVANRYALAIRQERDGCTERINDHYRQLEGQKEGIGREMARIQEQLRRLQEQLTSLELELQNLDARALLQEEALQREMEARVSAMEAELERELEKLVQRQKKAHTYLEEHAHVEIEPLEARARQAEELKGFVPLWDNMQRLQGELVQKRERAAWLDHCVNLARRLPAELLQQAELPVAGLGIDAEMQLTIDGLPIRNLSTGRQLRLALEIARATAGPFKLICIDRFESLDPINQALFFQEIEGDGYQYFISTTMLDRDKQGHYIPQLQVEALGEVGKRGGAAHARP